MPPFERIPLAGGLVLFLAVQHRLPLVEIELLLPAGAEHDPNDRRGLATLTAALMAEGTGSKTAMEIAGTVEKLGGWVSSSSDWDAAEVSTGLLARHLERGLEIVAEIATDPTFPGEELDRLRGLRLAEHRRRSSQPAALASDAVVELLYGDGVYGVSLLGTEASTRAITRDDVLRFHRRHAGAGGGALLVVGDVEPEPVKRSVERLLGDWRSGEPPAASPEIYSGAPPPVAVRVVDRPDAAQTELRVAQIGVPRSEPDWAVLQILNSLLGGKFTSRINLNLRERHGFTYGAHSRFAARRGPGPFVVSTAVANDVAGHATREILGEIERLLDEPVAEQELAETRSYLEGVFPYTLQSLEGVAARLRTLAVHGLADDYFETFLARIHDTGVEEIQAAARTHLDPDRMVVVAVGPARELGPQLESLGSVEVVAAPSPGG